VYLRHLLEWESIICYVLICALIFLKILSLILDSRIKPYFYGILTTIHSFCKKKGCPTRRPATPHMSPPTISDSQSHPLASSPPTRHRSLPPHSRSFYRWSFHRNSSPLPSKTQDSNLNRVSASHRITMHSATVPPLPPPYQSPLP
jgi:hypothetical protein